MRAISLFFAVAMSAVTSSVYAQKTSYAIPSNATVSIQKHAVVEMNDKSRKLTDPDDIASIPKNRKFDAPASMHDPYFSTMGLNAQQSTTLKTTEGYTIHIKANSLVDSKGNPVEGSYDLHFRDVTSLPNIVLAGIPMLYDSGGVRSWFQTGGMFEIYAEKDGEPLSLAPDSKIDIRLPSPDGDSGYNLYYFNEKSGKWEYDESLPSTEEAAPALPSIDIYSDAWRLRYLIRSRFVDSTSIEDRFASLDYARFKYMDTPVKKLLQKNKYLATKIPYFKIGMMYNEHFKRDILFKTPYLNEEQRGAVIRNYPEARILLTTTWKYTGNLSKRQFIQQYVRQKKYVDLRLTYDESANVFVFTLKTINGFTEIEAVPFYGRQTHWAGAQKRHVRLMRSYEKAFAKVKTNFEKYEFGMYRSEKRAKAMIEKQMSETELAMDWDEWKNYALRVATFMITFQQQNNALYVSRDISIVGFGLVNIDRKMRLEDPIELYANFTFPDGGKLQIQDVLMIDGSENSVQNCSSNGRGYHTVIDKKSNTIFCVVSNNEIYLVNASTVRELASQNKKPVFPLYHAGDDPGLAMAEAFFR